LTSKLPVPVALSNVWPLIVASGPAVMLTTLKVSTPGSLVVYV